MKNIARAFVIASVAAAAGVATPAFAQSTLINFDNLAEGTILSNQYASLGVTFTPNAFSGAGSSTSGASWATNTGMRVTATDLGGLGTPSLVSGNVLRAFGNIYTSDDWFDENGDPSFFINFTNAVTSFSLDFAGVATPADTRIFAYNGNTLLGVVAGTVTTGQFTLSYNAPSITRVAVAPGSFDDWVGVDNLRFTRATAVGVPEPAAWAMMIVGMGAVGFTMRRRQKVTTRVTFA